LVEKKEGKISRKAKKQKTENAKSKLTLRFLCFFRAAAASFSLRKTFLYLLP